MDNDFEVAVGKLYIGGFLQSVSENINDVYYGRSITIVPILQAAFMFTSDLIKYMEMPMIIRFVNVSSYNNGIQCGNPVISTKFKNSEIHNKDILIIDTIVDSGNTIRTVKERILNLSPKSIRTCALVIKDNEQNKDVSIDFPGFPGIKGFLFGYGTDRSDGTCRNLDQIYKEKG